jgi:hypothetical protein
MSDKDLFGNPISLSMRDVERHITEAANQSFLNGYKAGYENCRQELAKWISVKDKFPENQEIVAVWTEEGDIHAAWRIDNKWFMFNPCCSYESQLNSVTHWFELAELPEES